MCQPSDGISVLYITHESQGQSTCRGGTLFKYIYMMKYFAAVIILMIFISCKGIIDTPSAVFLGGIFILYIIVRASYYLNSRTMKKPKNLIYESPEEIPRKNDSEGIVFIGIICLIIIVIVVYAFFKLFTP